MKLFHTLLFRSPRLWDGPTNDFEEQSWKIDWQQKKFDTNNDIEIKSRLKDGLKEQSSIELEKNKEFLQQYKKLMNFFLPIPAISWHTLDMKVGENLIYDHLSIYQNKFAKKFATIPNFVEKMKLLDETIKKFKLDTRPSTKEKNVKDRSIVNGNDSWNREDRDNFWVPDVTFVRKVDWNLLEKLINKNNNGYTATRQNEKDIHNTIRNIKDSFNLNPGDYNNESDALELFVLRMWLGKYNFQNEQGVNFFNWSGHIAIGPVNDKNRVPVITIHNEFCKFGDMRASSAVAQLLFSNT